MISPQTPSSSNRRPLTLREQWVILLMIVVGTLLAIEPLWVNGASVLNAVLCISFVGLVSLLTLPRAWFGQTLGWSSIAGIVAAFLDLYGPAGRLPLPYPTARLLLAIVLLLGFIILLARNFPGFDIRTKIILGILATGGLALGIFSFIAVSQASVIVNSLSGRLEESVRALAEEQLNSTVGGEAEIADQSFRDVRVAVESLAQNWVALQSRKDVLSQGQYWDASKGVFQLDNGNYGNLLTDVSSLYVPPATEWNDELVADMNTSAYLDFSAPTVMEKFPAVIAMYAIDTRGVVRYYPNINLADALPTGFDARQRPYYEITAPRFNPDKKPRWTVPYVDATGAGLVVTVAVPVYTSREFRGIVAADMQLTALTQQVGTITIGQTGYAFMIDDEGHILSMPDAGYKLFGLDPESTTLEESFETSVLGLGVPGLTEAAARMTVGGRGLLTFNFEGVDYYISFAPITVNGYSLALVVPVDELEGPIIAAQATTQAQFRTGLRTAVIILLALLVFSILVSLVIGQFIASPIVRLTQTANEIVTGNLTAQAIVPSKDEIGNLADSFNTMTSRLRETLQGLEQRVEERTGQLTVANERNERRARQFEAIAQIASTITSTRDLDTLLRQVTTAISSRFGYYHVGVFLLDPRREYAVLSAANSEGGQRMLARQHKLRVGETGIVGFVTHTGKPRIALNTSEDAVYFNSADLPETRSEISLPLVVENVIIGALDVQSTEANAFHQEDVNILITLADQVAVAIQNSRQYDATQKALAEADAISRQFIQSGWKQFTKSQNLIGVHHTGAKATLLYANNGSDQDDNRQPDLERPRSQRGSSITLPVKLRGEIIGTVDVRSPDNQHWNQDDLDVVQAIIERAAIAMENARLLAESQKRAAKERTIGEISSRISALSDIDELLKTAAKELNRTLPGAEIAIQLTNHEEKQ